jgi:hypothetical protein
MRATASLALLLPNLVVLTAALSSAACVPKEHPDPDWLKPPESYDPVEAEGLTFNKAGVDALTLKEEGEERDAYVESLKGEGKFAGQAQCKSGAGTGTQAHSKYGEFELTCTAGTILFDIELTYHLFTSRATGKPLSANAYVEFGGTLVEFDYHDDSKPRQIVAKVEVGDDLRRLER